MDTALKQRLVGATVLIVLAIIFVPMLLDSTPRSDGQTVDLTLPAAPEQTFETRIVPLDAPRSAAQAIADDPDRIATVDTQVAPRNDALAGNEPQIAVSPGQTPGASPAPPAPGAALPSTPTPTVTPVPAAQAPTAQTSSAAPAALPVAIASGRFVIHFGSFAVRENAQTLAAELVRAGIRASTEAVEINGTQGLRVRAGPYADRTSAEKARMTARKVRPDIGANVIELDDTTAGDVAAVAPGRVVGWAVQVGALASAADANALRDKLRGGGFTAYVESLRGDRGTLYRVRVGPETQRANAERLRAALNARFKLDGQIVTHP